MTIQGVAPEVAAHAALASSEEAERAASAEVDTMRELHAVGRVPRGVLLKAQLALSKAQNATADAAAAARLLDREAEAGRAAAAAVAHREKVDRSAVLRLQAAALEARIGQWLVDVRQGFATIDREVGDFNREAAGAFLAPLRGPAEYVAWSRIDQGLSELARYWPAPKRTSTAITSTEES